MMTIEPYQGDIETLHQRILTDYTDLNPEPADQWEWSFYLEALQESIDSQQCYSCGESIAAINEDKIFYASWKGTDRENFLFLLYIFNKYKELRIQPLGKDFMGLLFLFNRASLRKYHESQVSSIRTDFARYDVLDLAVYTNG